MPRTGNDNWQLGKDLPSSEVDRLADELVMMFNNPSFRKWYCDIIIAIGDSKIEDLKKKVVDGKNPGKLFSHYAKQEKNALFNAWRLKQLRDDLNDK